MKVYVNGSNVGATNNADTTANTITDFDVWIGQKYDGTSAGAYIIDDLEILAKSQPAVMVVSKGATRRSTKRR